MKTMCQECGGKCCRYFCFEIDEPDDFEEFDDIRWFLLHEGVSVHIDEGDWFISIANKCKMLAPDNACTLYDERPVICRKYEMETCDVTDGDYGYDAAFETPDEIEAYAREVLGAAAYDREKAKALRKRQPPKRPKGRSRKSRDKQEAPSTKLRADATVKRP